MDLQITHQITPDSEAVRVEILRLESLSLAEKANVEDEPIWKERLLALSSIASLRAEEIEGRHR